MEENERTTKEKILKVLELIGVIVSLIGTIIFYIAVQLFRVCCFLFKVFIIVLAHTGAVFYKFLRVIAVILVKAAETPIDFSAFFHRRSSRRKHHGGLSISEMMFIDEIWDD